MGRSGKLLMLLMGLVTGGFYARAQLPDYQVVPTEVVTSFQAGIKQVRARQFEPGFASLDQALGQMWTYQIQDLPAYSMSLLRALEQSNPPGETFDRLLKYSRNFAPHSSEIAFARAALFLSPGHFSGSGALDEFNRGFKLLDFDLVEKRRLEAYVWLGSALFLEVVLLIFSLLVIGRYSRVLLHWAGHRLPEGYGSWALPAVLLLGLIPVFLGAPLWAAMAWPAVLCLPFATGRIKGIFMAALLCFSVSAYAEQRGKDLLIPLSNGPLLSQLNLGYGIAKSEDLSVLEAAAKKTGSPALALALAEAERRAGDVKTSSERLIGLLDNPEAGIIAYNQLACLYLDFDQIEEAVKTLETAAALNPTGPEVFYNLSQAYNGARRFEDSDRTYEKASQLDPEAVARFDLAKKLTGSNYYVARMPIPAGLLEQDLRRDRPWTSVLASGRYQFALFIISFILLVSLGLRNQTRLCRYCGKVICPKCRPESRVSGVCGPCHQIYLSGKAVDPKLKMAQRGRVRRYHILSGWSALVLNLLLPGSGLVLKEIAISGFMLMLWPMAFITSIILMRVAPEPLVPGVNLWPVWLAAAGAIYLVCGLLSILLYLKLVSVEA